MDHITPERRSWLMSQVKSKDSAAEMRVRRIAHSMGLRYRLHRCDLPGTPDLVFSTRRVVLFVHGCFWHRHPGCKKATMPKSRVGFWRSKFERNVARDRKAVRELQALGWTVEIIWECETRTVEAITERVSNIFGLESRTG